MRSGGCSGSALVTLALLHLNLGPPAAADPYYQQHLNHVTLKYPATEQTALAAQHMLFLYGPLVPPPDCTPHTLWPPQPQPAHAPIRLIAHAFAGKCWAMGNGQRDWRSGDLQGCRMFTAHEAGFTGDDIRELIPGLVANGTAVTYIDLAGSALIGGPTPSGAEALAELLGVPLTLEEINLERNLFTVTEVEVFAKALEGGCPARLRLGWNALAPAGAAALAAGFGAPGSGLRELSLESNAVVDAGAASLATALEANRDLHTVGNTVHTPARFSAIYAQRVPH